MSTHVPDEPGKDRAYLSSILLVLAIGAAAGSGSAIAPHAQVTRAPASPSGVVVLDDADGSVLRGAVVLQGATVVVIRPSGETVLPRASVRWFDTQSSQLSDAYWEAYPEGTVHTDELKDKGVATPKASRARSGYMVLCSGEVVVGDLLEVRGGVLVARPDGVRIQVPRTQVRWLEYGATAPTQDYWLRFSNELIDARFQLPPERIAGLKSLTASQAAYREAARKNPAVRKALDAHLGGQWDTATALWLEAYRSEGFKVLYLRNAAQTAESWFDGLLKGRRIEVLTRALNSLERWCRTRGIIERAEVKALLAKHLIESIHVTYRQGYPGTAQEFLRKLEALDGVYPEKAKALWEALGKQPPGPRIVPHERPR